MIRCGMYETNITPPLGSLIPGYFHERPASGIRDELFAKALVVDNGELTLAVLSIDALSVTESLVDAIRSRIREFVGIPPGNIMVAATHTHTGGPVAITQGGGDEEYAGFLVKRAADAVIMACNRRRSARIGFGRGFEDSIAFNRRYFMKDGSVRTNPPYADPMIDRPAGPIDPEVTVIRIDDADGNPMGLVTNYACHLDTIDGTEISGDFPGELSRIVKKVLGDKVVSIFLTGASGNINHRDVGKSDGMPREHYRKMGGILAGEVLKVRERITPVDNLKMAVKIGRVDANVRRPSEKDVKEALEILEAIPYKKVYDWCDEQTERYFAEQLLKVHESGQKTAGLEVQVMRLGDMSILGFPCELFAELGLDLKKRSPAGFNMIGTHINGSHGYVSTPEAFDQGGYEVRISCETNLAPDTGSKLVELALKLIRETGM